MPVRDDGSGIQNVLELLDSSLRRSKIPMPFPGNDDQDVFQAFYEFVKIRRQITPNWENRIFNLFLGRCHQIYVKRYLKNISKFHECDN